jgi:hypothetical protein
MKPEGRNPKAERRPKSEGRSEIASRGRENEPRGDVAGRWARQLVQRHADAATALLPISGFGLLSAFGFRPSGFTCPGFARGPRFTVIALCLGVLLFGQTAGLLAQQPALEEGRSRFGAVDIYVDSGSTPLAAYQLEFAATNGVAKIVGIEGGEHAAFRQPPFYDPKAIQHERVVLAGFSTADAAGLPTGKTRVATVHYQTTDSQPPRFELKLQTAGDAQGNKLHVQASFEERKMR